MGEQEALPQAGVGRRVEVEGVGDRRVAVAGLPGVTVVLHR